MFSKLLVTKFSVTKSSWKLIRCLSTVSTDLEKTILEKKWFLKIQEAHKFEKEMVEFFNANLGAMERKAHLKQSFIYMLIDPRISKNLPKASKHLRQHETWKRFISSIFYVGKGKSTRPHGHLHEALCSFGEHGNLKESNLKRRSLKTERIVDIWKSGNGVVCLHVFNNLLEAEALTREAALIETLSLKHLTNQRSGTFYGPVRMWPVQCKRKLGALILLKALQVYLAEGESQLLPMNV